MAGLGEFAAGEHVVDMGEDFAEGEAGLMGVELAFEHDAEEVGGGAGLGAAGVGEQGAAGGVVVGEFGGAGWQAGEGQLVAGQNQDFRWDGVGQGGERGEVFAKGVGLGFHRLDGDVGRDADEHLVGGEEQAVGRAMQHGLFGGVAAAGVDGKIAAADAEGLVGLEALEIQR